MKSSLRDEAVATVKKQSSKNIRIMIVDDDKEIGQYIKNELDKWYRFDCFTNGKEALETLLNGKYDLVISDVMMPVMDGITLLKKIKSNINISHIPVILLTSKADISDRLGRSEERCRRISCEAFQHGRTAHTH
jgi:CheY-like chemotaxis protein